MPPTFPVNSVVDANGDLHVPWSDDDAGGGTFDGVHNDLPGRSTASAHPAAAISVANIPGVTDQQAFNEAIRAQITGGSAVAVTGIIEDFDNDAGTVTAYKADGSTETVSMEPFGAGNEFLHRPTSHLYVADGNGNLALKVPGFDLRGWRFVYSAIYALDAGQEDEPEFAGVLAVTAADEDGESEGPAFVVNAALAGAGVAPEDIAAAVSDYLTANPPAVAALNDLTDVDAAEPADGDALVWDSGDSKWVPAALPETEAAVAVPNNLVGERWWPVSRGFVDGPNEEQQSHAELDDRALNAYADGSAGGFIKGSDGRVWNCNFMGENSSGCVEVTIDDMYGGAATSIAPIQSLPDGFGGAGGPIVDCGNGTGMMILHLEGAKWQYLAAGKVVADHTGVTVTYVGDIVTPNVTQVAAVGHDASTASAGAGHFMDITVDGTRWVYVFFTEWIDGDSDISLVGTSVARCAYADIVDAMTNDTAPVFSKWDGTGWTEDGLGGLGAAVPDAPSGGDIIELPDGVWMSVDMVGHIVEGTPEWWMTVQYTTDGLTWEPGETIAGPQSDDEWYSLTLYSGDPDNPKKATRATVWAYTTVSDPGNRWATNTIHRFPLRSDVRGKFTEVDAAVTEAVEAAEDAAEAAVEAVVDRVAAVEGYPRVFTLATGSGIGGDMLGGQALDETSDLDLDGGATIVFDTLTTFTGAVWMHPTAPIPGALLKGARFNNVVVTPGSFAGTGAGLNVSVTVGGLPPAGTPTVEGDGAAGWYFNDPPDGSASYDETILTTDPVTITIVLDEPITPTGAGLPGAAIVAVNGGSNTPPDQVAVASIEWLWEIPMQALFDLILTLD